MNQRLTFSTALLLTVAPVLWAGNAVVGRMVAPLVPPLTLNFLRWALAFLILLPFGWRMLAADSPIWDNMRRYAVLGLPTTKTRVEVGLNMKGVDGTERLTLLPPGAMFQYRVNLTDAAQVDSELIGWVSQAYDTAG